MQINKKIFNFNIKINFYHKIFEYFETVISTVKIKI